nr:hypothetical protein [Oscillospiraceae bacterium]
MELNKNNIEEINGFENSDEFAEALDKKSHSKKPRRKISKTAKFILFLSIIIFICSSAIIVQNYVIRQNNIEMNTELESVFGAENSEEEELFNFDEMLKIN